MVDFALGYICGMLTAVLVAAATWLILRRVHSAQGLPIVTGPSRPDHRKVLVYSASDRVREIEERAVGSRGGGPGG